MTRMFIGFLAVLFSGSAFAKPIDRPSPTLATSYVNVYVDPVKPGEEVNLVDAQDRGLVVRNGTPERLTIEAQLQIPASSALPAGTEPLPDPRWITLRPSSVRIAANTDYEIGVSVRVPGDRKYRGKVYGFDIITFAAPRDGAALEISPALRSRVRFKVAP